MMGISDILKLVSLIKTTKIEEVAVPSSHLHSELENLEQRIASGQLELRRIQEKKSGFLAYYVTKPGEPSIAAELQKAMSSLGG